jgi:integrase
MLDDMGKRKYFSPESMKPQVNQVNKLYKAGVLDAVEAIRQLDELIQATYRKEKNVAKILRRQRLSDDNEKVFQCFWHDVYADKYLEDEKSAYNDYLRAFKLLKDVSIVTGDKKAIRTVLQTNASGVAQHRRAVDRLNEILKYLKRDIRIEKPKAPIQKISHVNEAELGQILSKTPDVNLRSLIATLFATGMRLGEAIAVEPSDLFDGKIAVNKQVKRKAKGQSLDDRLKLPKREKTGHAVIVSSMREHVDRWVKVQDKEAYREVVGDHLRAVTRELWPNNKVKHVTPHDLRHSHAIHLLSKGASFTLIALNLRNRVEVVQKHYAGYSHVSETADLLKKLI